MIRTRTMFFVTCDLCGDVVFPVDGIVAWTDADTARVVAEESAWTVKGGKDYCSKHFICEAPECHNDAGAMAGEYDYLCPVHRDVSVTA